MLSPTIHREQSQLYIYIHTLSKRSFSTVNSGSNKTDYQDSRYSKESFYNFEGRCKTEHTCSMNMEVRYLMKITLSVYPPKANCCLHDFLGYSALETKRNSIPWKPQRNKLKIQTTTTSIQFFLHESTFIICICINLSSGQHSPLQNGGLLLGW